MTESPDAIAEQWASQLDGSYPRPQLVRRHWCDLGGSWDFAYDDDAVGLAEGWQHSTDRFDRTNFDRTHFDRTHFDRTHFDRSHFDRKIVVPFPPESKASGIGDTSFHPVVWYRRLITAEDLDRAGLGTQGDGVLLHFGAVDYQADVWLDGHYLGHHEGGQTPFAFDVTHQAAPERGPWSLVVRAEDDPFDVSQPRGKQDWQLEPHGIWYHRTTGIWQPVWLEAVSSPHITRVAWSTHLPSATVELSLELSARPRRAVSVRVTLRTAAGSEPLAVVQFRQSDPTSRTVITIPRQANGQAYETLLWSPETPHLVDAVIELTSDEHRLDTVASYFGLRSVSWADGHLMLNDRPCYLRSVLSQGYWPETQLAAPSADALRQEVQLIKDLGFNATRVHEKVEDPRFLYWADRLGVLVWEEQASAFEFSPLAVERMTREWVDVVRRDISHPCIVTWVPFNESWGVQHLAHDPAQLAFTRAIAHLTKALDPSRLVVTNDGWEHADSDIWTIHDYGTSREELAANYPDRKTVLEMMAGVGPLGRRMQLTDWSDRGQPVVVSEFGGVSYAPLEPQLAWGYVTVADAERFEYVLRDLFEGLQTSPVLAGFCYTQLTDTLQEANGLTDPYRRPKLPPECIRSIVRGDAVDIRSQRRPKRPVEQSHRLISERTQAYQEEVQS